MLFVAATATTLAIVSANPKTFIVVFLTDGAFGNEEALSSFAPEQFADERFGVPTIGDILTELRCPGCDPRPPFSSLAQAIMRIVRRGR